jgi:small conductance mechanosensitive channel
VADEVDETPGDGSLLREVEPIDLGELTDPAAILDVVVSAFLELAGDVLVRLPLIVVALVAMVVILILGRLAVSGVNRGMRRARVDFAVRRLLVNLLRVTVLLAALLLALAIAGVEIGAALAALGLIGLAFAFALQNILENQISGILILLRKPFVRGDLILTNGFEAYVEDIDLRVTTLREHDGTTTLVPNADVLTHPLTNFTRRGSRRTTVVVGVDYRDDHEAARKVLRATVVGVEGLLEDPPPEVLLVDLADSSVDFEVRFWTLADNRAVRTAKDQVLSSCKTALTDAGFTIPWPIRTLAGDRAPLQVEGAPDGQPPASGPLPAR